ncbi:MAG: response regulator [Myxococcota bacterium]|nr:response regulator [Myxococcota bacterium]
MKILVVDDSKPMRRLVIRNIKAAGWESAEFIQAANGKDALDLISSEKPNLVISDWNMPVMDGLELLKIVKKWYPNLPIGFVTSEGSNERRKIADNNGANFLISKPFGVSHFKNALGPLLSK